MEHPNDDVNRQNRRPRRLSMVGREKEELALLVDNPLQKYRDLAGNQQTQSAVNDQNRRPRRNTYAGNQQEEGQNSDSRQSRRPRRLSFVGREEEELQLRVGDELQRLLSTQRLRQQSQQFDQQHQQHQSRLDWLNQQIQRSQAELAELKNPGLKPARIGKFEHFVADESLVGETCLVCMDELKVGTAMVRLDCHVDHILCKVCVDTWFNEKTTCPTCRHDFS